MVLSCTERKPLANESPWRGLAGESEFEIRPGLHSALQAYRDRRREDAQALIRRGKRLARKEPDRGVNELRVTLQNLAREDLPERTVRLNQTSVTLGASFHAEMVKQYRSARATKGAGGASPTSTLLTEKDSGRRFAQRLKLPTAEIIARNARLSQVQFEPGTVVKPVRGSGSSGVFVVLDERKILEVLPGVHHRNAEEARGSADSIQEVKGVKRWHVERLLRGAEGETPPNDLKFYTFYGEVGLVLEVARTPVGNKYCWYDRQGEIVQTGKYEESSFEGGGLPEGSVDAIEEVSLKIPTPFMRIDTFRTDQGLIYGEFTARPGGYEQFDLAADRILGEMFIEAEARLYTDMQGGKEYPEFMAHARADAEHHRRTRENAPGT